MAKAHIVTVDGSTVNLEGTPAEIAALFKELRIEAQHSTPSTKAAAKKGSAKQQKTKSTVSDLIDELIGEQFFKKPKGLGDVKGRLADLGHHYPITSLSGPLQGYAKKRKLRRFRESGKYVYCQ
jgi:hypothetical protein